MNTEKLREMVDAALIGTSIDSPLSSYELAYKLVRSYISGDSEEVADQLRILTSDLILKGLLAKEKLTPYVNIVGILREAVRHYPQSRVEPTDWLSAISAVVANQVRFYQYSYNEAHLLSQERSVVAKAKAANTLREFGYSLTIANGNIVLEEGEEEKIAIEMDSLCKKIGGAALADVVFRANRHTYSKQLERFNIVRRVTSGPGPADPSVPAGLLLQMANKHMGNKPSGGQSDWDRLVHLSTASCAMFDVQPYSAFEQMFLKRKSILGFLQKTALYDSIFPFQQMNASHAILMMRGLLGPLGDELSFEGIPLGAVVRVGCLLIQVAEKENGKTFSIDYFLSLTNSNKKNVKNILKSVFTHQVSGVNLALTFPPRSNDIDATFRPLILDPKGDLYMPPATICAPAVFEAILAFARSAYAENHKKKSLDNRLGTLMEDFLQKQFSLRGVQVKTGKYDFGETEEGRSQNGECDLVIETDTQIFFLELKKKVLTRLARSGDDVSILMDLSKSVIDSQLQIMRHEYLLKTYGSMKLTSPSGEVVEIQHKGRDIERVSVSLTDFGGMQDRLFLNQLLTICCQVEFEHTDLDHNERLTELNTKLRELRKWAVQLGDFSGPAPRPFNSAWFVSIPQLLMFLDRTKGSAGFEEELRSVRQVSTGSRDLYFEYDQALGRPRPWAVARPTTLVSA